MSKLSEWKCLINQDKYLNSCTVFNLTKKLSAQNGTSKKTKEEQHSDKIYSKIDNPHLK